MLLLDQLIRFLDYHAQITKVIGIFCFTGSPKNQTIGNVFGVYPTDTIGANQ